MATDGSVRVVSTGHHVTDARLSRIAAALDRRGLRVTLEALGRPSELRTVGSGLQARVRPRAALPTRLFRALRESFGQRADVLLIVDPELVLPALIWRHRTGGVLVIDVHEDYRAVALDRSWSKGPTRWFAALLTSAAVSGARRADLTIVADDQVPPLSAPSRLVIPNRPAAGEIPRSSAFAWPPRALYVGDVRKSRGLHTMVDAVLAAPPWEIDIVGEVASRDRSWLASKSTESRGRVRAYGRLPHAEAWELARGAAAGLALLERTVAFECAIPTKLYEYLSAGLAVIVTPLPRMAAIVQTTGAGKTASDASAAAAVLRHWAQHPRELEAHRRAAETWADHNLRPTSPFDELAAEVEALLQSRSQ